MSEPKDYFLRPAKTADEAAVVSLIEGIRRGLEIELSLQDRDCDLRDLEAHYRRPRASFDVLIHQPTGGIVGTIALEPIGDNEVELRRMYLREDHRGRGLGRYLLTHAVQRARALDFCRILAGTTGAFRNAAALYESIGFVRMEKRQLPPPAEMTYALELDPPPTRIAETKGEYELREGAEFVDFTRVHRWLTSSYWTPGIGVDPIIRAARGSAIVLSAHHPDFGQVAYGRVISDRARFAYIGDIWVDELHRGRGLARALVEFAINHPELALVRTWTLATRDAHGVYAPLGFFPMSDPVAHAQTWMIRRVGDLGWMKTD